jgi:putative hemolysin
MSVPPWLWGLIACVAWLLGGLLSTLQNCLYASGRGMLEQIAQRHNRPRGMQRVEAILDDIEGHVTAIALPRIVLNLLCVVATVLWIRDLRGSGSTDVVDVLAGILTAAVFIWLASMAVPLSIAEHAAERTVYAWASPIRLWHTVMAPFRHVFGFTNEVVRRLAGGTQRTPQDELELELAAVMEEHHGEGNIDETERDMIEAVVEFRTTTVEQIMTPRTEVEAFEYSDDLEKVKRLIEEKGHSRIPVYEENLDHLVGMLYAKDLLRWMVSDAAQRGDPFVLRDLLRPVTFVPETKTVRELLSELLAAKVHIAVVIDEYGGTSGLVTIEDIIEEVFGEIQDEYDPVDENEGTVIIDLAAREAVIDARCPIHEANDRIEDLGIELPESDDYDTVGGFVVVTLGRIPQPGESLTQEGVLVRVLEAEPNRVVRVAVRAATDEDRTRAAEPQSADAPEPEPAARDR